MGEIADPALQVIVLGSGGGPQESNITAFLVRSVAEKWSKGSIIAVDAGVHLSAITRLLQESYPSTTPSDLPFTLSTGAFAGLELPYASAAANAAHITRSLVDTYLITHPHLDHISGFVVNTAGLPGTRPKKLAGLPSTIQAFKNHIFNNVIWPNLSDENNGAGLLTYLRLVEGGSPALGDGEGKGYMEVCDGLLVKTWSVSHGHCIERHPHRGSASSVSTRFGSHDASSQTPRRDIHYHMAMQPTPKATGLLSQAAFSAVSSPQLGASNEQEKFCVYDSSAYFIRDQSHRREVLIFGDVEPDSISLSPRNLYVWQEAAPRIVSGILAAIFIECSYDDSQSNDRLFGHLKPCFIMDELRVLANEVEIAQKLGNFDSKKRKRSSMDEIMNQRRNPFSKQGSMYDDSVSPKSINPTVLKQEATPGHVDTPHLATPTDELSLHDFGSMDPILAEKPLEGLKVIIIHVKERLEDGPQVGDVILQQLQDHEKEMNLGCKFIMSKSGMSLYF
ncbi:3',5'-cyclic-nucleotide phosphodiesterase pde1 [Metarhizium acridum]|uniref:3',5'-cyclic-nucleotide phosphodiesterase pde1 n=1 Tax=Metarhizium acridum TaxID=92637 RepID=UPI001C6CF217|nr:3',5'-cyclic-nucleotide phosphodiesterase pde1 [Metarhizium acridum]